MFSLLCEFIHGFNIFIVKRPFTNNLIMNKMLQPNISLDFYSIPAIFSNIINEETEIVEVS